MNWIKDRFLLLCVSLFAAIFAYFFWNVLGQYAFIVFPLIALYAIFIEAPALKKRRQR